MTRSATEHETTDQVVGKAHEALDNAAETLGKAEEYTREHASQADERVRENPLISIGIAFIVGVLFSWLTTRRR